MANAEIMGLEGTEAVNSEILTKGSRAEFLAFLTEVRPDIRQLITDTKLKLADGRIFSLKPASGKTIKMFESNDPKQRGICNITNGKLPKNRVFLASAISLTAALTYKDGTTRADDPSMGKKATFRPIDELFKTSNITYKNTLNEVFVLPEGSTEAENAAALGITLAQVAALTAIGAIITEDTDSLFAGLESGDFTLKADRKELLTEMPLTVFKKHPNGHRAPGLYKLDNPRLIQDEVDIEFIIELGEEVDHDGNESCVWIRLEIVGTQTIA